MQEEMKGPVEANMAIKEDDFSEYMWMGEENLDDFDKQVRKTNLRGFINGFCYIIL